MLKSSYLVSVGWNLSSRLIASFGTWRSPFFIIPDGIYLSPLEKLFVSDEAPNHAMVELILIRLL